MNRLSDVTAVTLPRRCVERVHAHLRTVGRAGHEGLGLWVGRQSGSTFEVMEAVVPAQTHRRTPDGVGVGVDGDELHRLNVALHKADAILIAQIHSHPGRAYHSDTDDAFAIATAVGSLSLVVPDFAAAPFDLARTACYRLDRGGRWLPFEAASLIRLTD